MNKVDMKIERTDGEPIPEGAEEEALKIAQVAMEMGEKLKEVVGGDVKFVLVTMNMSDIEDGQTAVRSQLVCNIEDKRLVASLISDLALRMFVAGFSEEQREGYEKLKAAMKELGANHNPGGKVH